MSDYKIEPAPFTVTPFPPRVEDRWPFLQLEVGQGFYVSAHEAINARPAASTVGKRNGRKFSSKLMDDGKYFIYRRA